MANIGYVRFQNTLSDLRDCNDHLFDEDLLEDEERARKQLINLCLDIASEFESDDDSDDDAE